MFDTDIDCLTNGAPHGQSVKRFVDMLGNLASGPESFATRTLIAWELFQRTESLLEQEHFFIEDFSTLLDELAAACQRLNEGQRDFLHKLNFSQWVQEETSFREDTAEHYGSLFEAFDNWHYYEEATQLLRLRLARNAIDLGNIRKQKALDAGCGGGRYTVALKEIGFNDVVGVDFSEKNIVTANHRIRTRQISGIEFKEGNVLDLPFPEESFDFVFSNGVIHHTESVEKGISEINRVLKRGGLGWLYIMERPGGLHWDMVEVLRNLMRPVNKAYARVMLEMLGVPRNRIFYILDHVMVPINTRLTPQEIETIFADNGLKARQRLTRGADFDRAEQVYKHSAQNKKDIEWKFGVGENRYILEKT
jgi:ubiquinone/menaquinone biosynthesis C-methylase UbiE